MPTSGGRCLPVPAIVAEYTAALRPSRLQVFNQACFDQGSMLLHSGEKTPNHPQFTPELLFKAANYPCELCFDLFLTHSHEDWAPSGLALSC